jgi:hypothetical protein
MSCDDFFVLTLNHAHFVKTHKHAYVQIITLNSLLCTYWLVYTLYSSIFIHVLLASQPCSNRMHYFSNGVDYFREIIFHRPNH